MVATDFASRLARAKEAAVAALALADAAAAAPSCAAVTFGEVAFPGAGITRAAASLVESAPVLVARLRAARRDGGDNGSGTAAAARVVVDASAFAALNRAVAAV